MTGCLAIFIISLNKRCFEKSFGSNILASFTKFQCQGTDTFGLIRVQTLENHIPFEAIFYINNEWILEKKVYVLSFLVISEINSGH